MKETEKGNEQESFFFFLYSMAPLGRVTSYEIEYKCMTRGGSNHRSQTTRVTEPRRGEGQTQVFFLSFSQSRSHQTPRVDSSFSSFSVRERDLKSGFVE